MIDSQLREIARAPGFVAEFCARHGLPERDSAALCVILDELLNNAIRHALGEASGHEISLVLDYGDGHIRLEIEHGGLAFDPTAAPAPALVGTLAERRPGGVGIAFVRGLTDSFEYQRVQGRNRLILTRRAMA